MKKNEIGNLHKVLFEILAFGQLIIFPALYGTRRFITALTEAHYWSVP
jgi:hypothetical protein